MSYFTKGKTQKESKRETITVHKQKILSDKQQDGLECADKEPVHNGIEVLQEGWPAFQQAP